MHTRHHPLLSPSLGTRRQLTSFHFGAPGSGQKVYIQASLHADELPGMLTAWHLKRELAQLEAQGALQGEVVLAPMANPIGLDQNVDSLLLGRFELNSGENFNRHYTALAEDVYAEVSEQLGQDAAANVALIRASMKRLLAAQTPRTELQSLRHTLHTLACDADVMLDLHCDNRAALHLFTLTPLWPQCEPLARHLGACATLLAEDSGDLPIDEALSQPWLTLQRLAAGRDVAIPLACLAITVELRGERDIAHEYAQQDAAGILAFLRHRGVVKGAAAPLPELPWPATPLAGSEDLYAPHAGVVVYHTKPGQEVQSGELLAEVIDPLHDQVSEIRAQRPGMLYATSSRTYATAGLLLARVAGKEAFKSGKLLTAR